MTNGILAGLAISLKPGSLLACFLGVLLGTLVGALPGMGPAAAMALLLPVAAGLDPTVGLIMLAGIYYGAMYGGSTTAILVNVPGEPASVVTAIDGYPLARRGRAGAALAVAAIGSFVAGTSSVVALQFFAPQLADAALAFGPAEYFAISLLGLVLLSNLSGQSRLKSLLMVSSGVALSTVGMDPLGGISRFTFGHIPAQAGFSFVAVTTGLFGLSEVLEQLSKRKQIVAAPLRVKLRELYPNRRELRRALPPMLRGSVLGFLIGLMPGPSATLASFVSYSLERRLARRPRRFGRGAIEGVAGPEAANNAACAGGMVPLLSLGLPFSPSTAVLLSAMLMVGITPGPLLVKEHPQVFWGVIGSLYVGNAILLVLNLPLVGIFARIAQIRSNLLMPAVLVLCVIGAYGDNNSLFDVWVMLAAGVAGYAMRHRGYEPAPLVLGLVLGPILERSLLRALIIGGGELGSLWSSKISACLLVAAMLGIVVPIGSALWRRARRPSGEPAVPSNSIGMAS